jgi:hypothetical protein
MLRAAMHRPDIIIRKSQKQPAQNQTAAKGKK